MHNMNNDSQKVSHAVGSPAAYVLAAEGHCPAKPNAIIRGQSQAEGMAEFACGMTYEDLTAERRERLKVSNCGVLGSGKGVRQRERSLHTH
jgi:hypothetical protein